MTPYGIHWFRRDLRLEGNAAFNLNASKFGGKVLSVFCFDKKFLSREDFSVNRFQFFLETLKILKNQIEAMGGEFIFLDVGPEEAFGKLFAQLQKKGLELPKLVTWNRDYEPFAIHRDKRLEKWFKAKGVEVLHERDHLLIEPDEIVKSSDPSAPFQIFTPFSKTWLELFKTPGVQARLQRASTKPEKIISVAPRLCDEETFEDYYRKNLKKVTVAIPAAGLDSAVKQLKAFSKKVSEYGARRDLPSVSGTSHLSIYFKNGSLTTFQTMAQLRLLKAEGGAAVFLKELIWREFYYYILFKNPHVEKESFNPKYRKLEWENREDYFEAWKEGRTGFPIVDAGMRQLKQTGWMHNRVRMIVASFLTKDLLIDWRWGEKFFMEQLLDGDLAPNNGGWQWAASTGCDPQPYFRIFNPELQAKKFDPDGKYIRQYVPEWGTDKYPSPIVEHSEQREKALKLFKKISL